jgi:hypothetical protein
MSIDLGASATTPFSVARVINDTLRVLKGNLASCAVVAASYVALWHVAVMMAYGSGDGFGWWNFTVRALWTCTLGGLANATLIYVVLAALRGNRPSPWDLRRGLSFAIPSIVVFFISDLPSIVSSLPGATDPDPSRTLVIQVGIAVIGYFLSALWLAAPPSLIAERLGVFSALRRSMFLTAGRRWAVFGLIFAVGIIFWILEWGFFFLGNALNAQVGHTGPNLVFWIGDFVVPAFALVFCAVVQTVAYCALRLAREGAAVNDLAQVFE